MFFFIDLSGGVSQSWTTECPLFFGGEFCFVKGKKEKLNFPIIYEQRSQDKCILGPDDWL